MSGNHKKDDVIIEALHVEAVVHHPSCPAHSQNRRSGGPAMVNTEDYRDNWETIFGKKVSPGSA